MSIVNFSIPKTLEKRVSNVIRQKGFASRAEFFRFAAIYFMDVIEKPFFNEDDRFDYLTKAVSQEMTSLYRGKNIPSLKEQLGSINAD